MSYSLLQNSSNFPQRLFVLMDNNHTDLINWCEHGLSFRIHDSDKFSSTILPKYFKHAKFTSFQRQLNLYGFKRITKGEDSGAYFHPKFQRGRKDLLNEIKRIPNKSLAGYMDTYEYSTIDIKNNPESLILVDVFLNESPNEKSNSKNSNTIGDITSSNSNIIKNTKNNKAVDDDNDDDDDDLLDLLRTINQQSSLSRINSDNLLYKLNSENEINIRAPLVFPTKKKSAVNFNSRPRLGGPSKLTINIGYSDLMKNKANMAMPL